MYAATCCCSRGLRANYLGDLTPPFLLLSLPPSPSRARFQQAHVLLQQKAVPRRNVEGLKAPREQVDPSEREWSACLLRVRRGRREEIGLHKYFAI